MNFCLILIKKIITFQFFIHLKSVIRFSNQSIHLQKLLINLKMPLQAATSQNHFNNGVSRLNIPAEIINTINTDHKECRICFSSHEEAQNQLISPCSCAGSIKYVHHNCLKQWIDRVLSIKNENEEGQEGQKIECQLCKSRISFTLQMRKECRGWQQFKSVVRILVVEFVLLMFCFLISITLLVFSIVEMSLMINKGLQNIDMVQKIVVFAAFAIGVAGCLYLLHSSLKFFMKRKTQIKFQNRQI